MDFSSLPFGLDENPSYLNGTTYKGNTWVDPSTGDKYRCCYNASAITSSVGTKWAAFSSGDNAVVAVAGGHASDGKVVAGVYASGATTLTASSQVWVQTEGIAPVAIPAATTGNVGAPIGCNSAGQCEILAVTGSNVGNVLGHLAVANTTAMTTATVKLRGLD